MKATINSSKFCSSKFLTCSIRQILSDFSTVKVLRYMLFGWCYDLYNKCQLLLVSGYLDALMKEYLLKVNTKINIVQKITEVARWFGGHSP